MNKLSWLLAIFPIGLTAIGYWLLSTGELKEINYHIQQLKRGRFFALVACDVHSCGFVTGAGLAVGREDAKQLAAQQAAQVLKGWLKRDLFDIL